MEHFEMPAGELAVANPRTTKTKLYQLAFPGNTPRGELALSPSAQKEHRILNGTASVEPGDPAELVASSALAQAVLGWRPRFSDVDTIIRSAWEWHQRHPNGYAS